MNKKDYYKQMLLWLEHWEKMWAFEIVLQWHQGTMPQPQSRHLQCHALGPHLAKTPSVSNMQLSILVRNHDANGFIPELHAFISRCGCATSGISHFGLFSDSLVR